MGERVLSIQSHVTFGYVGGKAAVFPLQCLNYDVDVVNTVCFSNHSGYGRFGGSKASAQELSGIFDLLEANGLLSPSRLLTGYIPGAEPLSVIANLAKKLRRSRPDLIYLLDPVLGDSGKLYVAPEVVPIYRELLPLSTIITPNWYEVEVLTKVQLRDVSSLKRALQILHEEYQVPNVVISSLPLHDFTHDKLPLIVEDEETDLTPSDLLLCVCSAHTPGSAKGKSTVHTRCLPCLPGYFSGVGDLFSALVLAHYDRQTRDLAAATAHALTKTFEILRLTHEQASQDPDVTGSLTDEERDVVEPDRRVRRMRGRELRLIQGQDILRGTTRPAIHRHMTLWEDFWE